MNVCIDGKFFPADASLLTVQNRSYKWGDGVFETAKVFQRKFLLEELHFERLFTSLTLLQIEKELSFTQSSLIAQSLQLCDQNNCSQLARVRLAVYRKEDNSAGYTIEALPLEEDVNQWHGEGQEIVLYPFVRKSTDAFANIKSANYLPYIMAQRYAIEKKADDALVLNSQNFLCDSSKANIFLIKGNGVYTPAIHQGCVNGVMRRLVIEEVKKLGYRMHQDVIDEAQLLAADEVFLTNAIQIIRWVEYYKGTQFGFTQTRRIFDAVSATIFRGHC